MGADGGSIPKRVELVKTKTKVPKSDTDKLAKLDSFKYCALSKEPLQVPIVACKYGRLYNKEAIIKFLLDRKTFSDVDSLPHIKSLKDIVKLRVTPNPAFSTANTLRVSEVSDSGSSPFICPVTGKEMNGNFKFIYLKGCGCVLSELALKEISAETCLQCSKSRTDNDIIELDPNRKINDTDEGSRVKLKERKRPAEEEPIIDDVPYLPNENGYRPSISGLASFRKTSTISSLYKE